MMSLEMENWMKSKCTVEAKATGLGDWCLKKQQSGFISTEAGQGSITHGERAHWGKITDGDASLA